MPPPPGIPPPVPPPPASGGPPPKNSGAKAPKKPPPPAGTKPGKQKPFPCDRPPSSAPPPLPSAAPSGPPTNGHSRPTQKEDGRRKSSPEGIQEIQSELTTGNKVKNPPPNPPPSMEVVVGEKDEAHDVVPRKKMGHRQSFEDFVSKEKDRKVKAEKPTIEVKPMCSTAGCGSTDDCEQDEGDRMWYCKKCWNEFDHQASVTHPGAPQRPRLSVAEGSANFSPEIRSQLQEAAAKATAENGGIISLPDETGTKVVVTSSSRKMVPTSPTFQQLMASKMDNNKRLVEITTSDRAPRRGSLFSNLELVQTDVGEAIDVTDIFPEGSPKALLEAAAKGLMYQAPGKKPKKEVNLEAFERLAAKRTAAMEMRLCDGFKELSLRGGHVGMLRSGNDHIAKDNVVDEETRKFNEGKLERTGFNSAKGRRSRSKSPIKRTEKSINRILTELEASVVDEQGNILRHEVDKMLTTENKGLNLSPSHAQKIASLAQPSHSSMARWSVKAPEKKELFSIHKLDFKKKNVAEERELEKKLKESKLRLKKKMEKGLYV
ncbi:hypothetical protein TrST_g2086 [Triparma strigata]|uniref:Uncharacterized protein n=1 Tax=Triparma strigata TaxID=1606541 RepID=A0A9W7BHT1_9STRA|nr:hypothetical protein TrST_g2086 [Triparma strigata]